MQFYSLRNLQIEWAQEQKSCLEILLTEIKQQEVDLNEILGGDLDLHCELTEKERLKMNH